MYTFVFTQDNRELVPAQAVQVRTAQVHDFMRNFPITRLRALSDYCVEVFYDSMMVGARVYIIGPIDDWKE